MIRKRLQNRTLPDYNLAEELINSISHGLGAVFGIIVLILLIIKAIKNNSVAQLITGIIYSFSLIALYTCSTVYHAVTNEFTKKIMQIIDHCMIYILIGGSYTPILVCSIMKISPAKSIILLIIIWIIIAISIVLNSIDLHKYRVFSHVSYIVLGWIVLTILKDTYLALTHDGFMILLYGGIAYTIGAILYGIGSKIRYFHSIFHFFVLAGSIIQFISIYLYVFI
ncbi:MAG: hemolysin III family protein [Bacillota bacterium]|jgi:hemolysin III|nr:hemolysin III family protein [Bacillota bacterium]NLL26939.1 hemolysin III family protein [Erysipelotrichia bacterium]